MRVALAPAIVQGIFGPSADLSVAALGLAGGMVVSGRTGVSGWMTEAVAQESAAGAVVSKPLSRKRSAASQTPQVLLYHKPTGELVTRDDPGSRPKVFGSAL